MSIELITVLMFASMIVLLLTGQYIFFIVGAVASVSAIALWGTGGLDMVFFSTYSFTNWFILLAFPQFVFMGITLSKSGVADNLFQAIYLWMGRVRGGLGMGTIGLCTLVAAMSGTNVAATVTAGTIALPSMLKRKYDKLMVTGVIQAGGALGFLIPPSLVFIVYGLISRTSIGHLWVAGILPGILLAVMYIIYIGVRCRIQPHLGPAIPEAERVGWREKFIALRSGIGPIILIFAVLGLLFMGVTTLMECAAIGMVGAIALAAINRRLTKQVIMETMDETLKITSMLMWIFVAAILFGAVFDGLGATDAVDKLLTMAGGGRWGTMLMMQASFVLMGMVLDDTAMLLIVAPLYIPIVAKLGFSLVWFGVLYVLNCQIAYLTPPFGYNLFIMKGLIPSVAPDSGIRLVDIYKSVIPFVGIQAVCLGIVMAFPQIALWLPSVIMGR